MTRWLRYDEAPSEEEIDAYRKAFGSPKRYTYWHVGWCSKHGHYQHKQASGCPICHTDQPGDSR